MKQDMPELKNVVLHDDIKHCIHCRLAKAKKLPFNEERTRATKILEKVHSDTLGPITPCAYRTGNKYIVTFTDDFSRYAQCYTMFDKTQAHIALEKFLTHLRELLQFDYRPIEHMQSNKEGTTLTCRNGKLHTDHGTEFKTQQMKNLLTKEGIIWDPCNKRTPQHNAVAERLNLDIEQKVRAQLSSAGMPASFWSLSLEYVMHIHNRSTSRSLEGISPFEKLTGKKPKRTNFRRFGCQAVVTLQQPQTKHTKSQKFHLTGELGFLIGITNHGYRILMNKDLRVLTTKHVTFDESRVYGDYRGKTARFTAPLTFEPIDLCDCCNTDQEIQPKTNEVINPPQVDIIDDSDHEEEFEGMSDDETNQTFVPNFEPPLTRARFNKIRNNDDDYDIVTIEEVEFDDGTAFLTSNIDRNLLYEPKTYKQATNCNEAKEWTQAMQEEIQSLLKHKTWEYVPREDVPKDASEVTCRWLYKNQLKPNGIRRRARVIAQGFKDTIKYKYEELYAPVSCIRDVRILLHFANKLNLNMRHLDVKTAFLHGELEREIYMTMPPGLPEYLNKPPNYSKTHTLKLKKSIYGLKVSPKCWFDKFTAALRKMNLKQYDFRPCIYYWKNSSAQNEKLLILLVYVDDILIVTNDTNKEQEVIQGLSKDFTITDLGEPEKYLGIDLTRDRKNQIIKLTQETWTKETIGKFDLGKSKRVVKTPMLTNDAVVKSKIKTKNISKSKHKNANKNKVITNIKTKIPLSKQDLKQYRDIPNPPGFNQRNYPYRNAIGALLYLNNSTRPDISFAVNRLGRRQCNYGYSDWLEIQRVLRYIRDTSNLGLTYTYSNELEDAFEIFVDASLGSGKDEGRSTTGFAIMIDGNLVDWKTLLQKHVSLSSAEAEYVAMSRVCREIVSIQALCKILFNYNIKPTIYEDNRAAKKVAQTEESQTFRHLVDLHYHYVRQLYKEGKIDIEWINTDDQLGDFFTKAQPAPKFIPNRNKLMNIN